MRIIGPRELIIFAIVVVIENVIEMLIRHADVMQVQFDARIMQLKNTIFEQARENYPQQISENKIEEWWLKLKEEAAP